MELSPARREALYWLLIALVFPALNWWAGLWVLVLARDAIPLLVVTPLLLGAESLAAIRLLRGASMQVRRLATAGLLLVTTLAWSFALTLVLSGLQKNAFTF